MTTPPFTLGWEEWLSLPDLGVPAIKAKIDTGARTSSLHAFRVEAFGPADKPQVRFAIHPIPGRNDIEVWSTADIVDRREVTSSNGEREMRYVIRSQVRMGERMWPIEITLANREGMTYRMLLGRQAILDDMIVEPNSSFRQPKLGYRVYGPSTTEAEGRRSLTIALLTRRPENATNRRIARMAERRGHRITVIDRTRVSLYVDAREPAMFVEGRPLETLDAGIVRMGRSPGAFSLAVVRQMEALGASCLPSSEALMRLQDPLAVRQILARQRVAIPEVAVSHADFSRTRGESPVLADSLGALTRGPLLRFAIIGGRGLAVVRREAMRALDDVLPWHTVEPTPDVELARGVAETAAHAVGLDLGAVDLALTKQGVIVTDVSPSLSIAAFERTTGAALVEALIVYMEQDARARLNRVGV